MMRALRTLLTIGLLSLPMVTAASGGASAETGYFSGDPGSIITLAGGRHGDGLPGPEASVIPRGVAVGPDGLVYISDFFHHRIRRVAADGTVEPFAGHIIGNGGEGRDALEASLDRPMGIEFDDDGNLYIADGGNHQIRKITPNRVITRIAGDGVRETSGDGGPAKQASMRFPTDVAVDSEGNVYIAESEGSRVRRVDADTGIIETYAGGGLLPFREGAKATDISIRPQGLAIGADDDLYVTDGCAVRRVDAEAQTITTVVGGGCGFAGDGGPALAARLGSANFGGPFGLDITPDGRLWIADSGNYRVRVVGTDGTIETVAGNGDPLGALGDGGPAVQATIQYPMGTAVDSAGNLYIATEQVLGSNTSDKKGHYRIRVVRPDGMIDTYVGTGGWAPKPASGRPAIGAGFGLVNGLAWDDQNRLYIAAVGSETSDGGNLWRLDPDGRLHLVAGNGKIENLDTGNETGPALSVPIYPVGLDVGPDGRVYFADAQAWQVKVYDPVRETIEVVAGKKVKNPSRAPVPPSQFATAAEFVDPLGVSVAPDGTIYVTEGDHDMRAEMSRVRRVRGGQVEMVAGLPKGTDGAGFNGDGRPATESMLMGPWGIDVLPGGDLLIPEVVNRRVRRYDAQTRTLTTAIGDGAEDSRVGTIGQLSSLEYPRDVEPDGQGGFFVTDGNVRDFYSPTHIVHVAASGTTSYVAGTGVVDIGRDGPALSQGLFDPRALALGPAGLAIADYHRVRLLIPPQEDWPNPPRHVVCLPNAPDIPGDSNGQIVADTPNNPNFDVRGTEVRTIGSDLEVTIKLEDLDLATMWAPGSLGQWPGWAYQIWDGGTKVRYLAAFATASLDDPAGAKPGGFVFEVGEGTGGAGIDPQEGREMTMTMRRLASATGSVDLQANTVTIRAPLSSIGYKLGDHTWRQYGIAGQVLQLPLGASNFRSLSFYDTTPPESRFRTIVFGRNCPDAWS